MRTRYVANLVGPYKDDAEYGIYDLETHQFVERGLSADEAEQRAHDRSEAAGKRA